MMIAFKKLTTSLFCLLLTSIVFFSPIVANASCPVPNIDKKFLEPFETETIKWQIDDVHFYEDKDAGLSIKFLSDGTTIDYYVYDQGKTDIDQNMVDLELRQSVHSMLKFYEIYEPKATISSPRLISEDYFGGVAERLVKKGVFVTSDKSDFAEISIIGVGFDGRCFQKLRLSKNLSYGNTADESTRRAEVTVAIITFRGFVKALSQELERSGFYLN